MCILAEPIRLNCIACHSNESEFTTAWAEAAELNALRHI